MGAVRITRHVALVDGRRVHYSRAGDGPALLVLHESPCSGRSMAEAQEIFAERFTAIAPDTPGYGLSDPLPSVEPEIADFADALAGLLDALGIGQAAVYGRHTGASIAAEFALRHPGRCAMLLTAGLPVYSVAQRQSRLTEYLRPLVPGWDGTHLVWLWFRYREQHVFWPWHDQRAERRSDEDVPDLAFLHRGVVEFLEAGDGYRVAYAAAFRHGGTALGLASALTVPACFAARNGDSLFRTLPLFPPGTWTEALPRDQAEATRAESGLLSRFPAAGTVPPAPDGVPAGDMGYLDMGDGTQLLLRQAGRPGAGMPILVLHHAPGSTAALDGLLCALGAGRHAIAFDLPGCGESVPGADFVPGVAAWARTAVAVLDRLGLDRVHLLGSGSGCTVAAELARQVPDRVASVMLDGPPVLPDTVPAAGRNAFAAAYAPCAVPEWYGGHLLRVWHHLRDQELWWPWTERTRAHARPGEPSIDPAALTARARDCLKQPWTYQPAWQATWSYDLPSTLAGLRVPLAVLATEGELFGHLAPLAAAAAGAPCHAVPADLAARARRILDLLPG